MTIKKIVRKVKSKYNIIKLEKNYLKKYEKYAFNPNETSYNSYEQYEAVITRLYHTVEKCLAFNNFTPGRGKKNVKLLINVMKNYILDGYNKDSYFYNCAYSALVEYVNINEKNGCKDDEIKSILTGLEGNDNKQGGIIKYQPYSVDDIQKLNYEKFIKSRHSIRHFTEKKVEMDSVINALNLAQFTPSACNRQGWKTLIVDQKDIIKKVLNNQNGNEGFGNEFDKLILVLGDLKFFNNDRELFQVFIDSGMYAQSILNSLYYYGIGSVPLSASLSVEQDNNIRKILDIKENEIIILFIGIGSFPKNCITTKSSRRIPNTRIV